jgi:hypothetical protein
MSQNLHFVIWQYIFADLIFIQTSIRINQCNVIKGLLKSFASFFNKEEIKNPLLNTRTKICRQAEFYYKAIKKRKCKITKL